MDQSTFVTRMARRILELGAAFVLLAHVARSERELDRSEALLVAAESFEAVGGYADPKLAILYEQAADLGSARAHWELSVAHALGWNVELDEELALVHLYFASSGNHTLAQMAMGFRHKYGIGVPRSCATSVLYYNGPAKAVVEQSAVPGSLKKVERFRIDTSESRRMAGRQEEIVEYYRYSADQGDAAAQLVVGFLLNEGSAGLEKDRAKAFQYFLNAAEKGEPDAVAQVGHMYANGFGVEKNPEKAIHYFQDAVNQGSASGSYGLGYMYLAGEGVEKDYSRAYQNFKVAADRKHLESHFHLGVLHLLGQGCRRDTAKAMRFFNIASQYGHTLSMYNLAMMYLKGHGTTPSCSSALSILKSVAEQGEVAGVLATARKAFIKHQTDTAMMEYARAALAGFELAQVNLAWLLNQKKRTSITRDWTNEDFERESLKFHHLSALQGNLQSLLQTGDGFYYGRGTKQNIQRSKDVYLQASRLNNPQALFNLGLMYEHAIGVPQDFHMAKHYFERSLLASDESTVPARLALTKLWVHEQLTAHLGNWTLPLPSQLFPSLSTFTMSTHASRVLSQFLQADVEMLLVILLGTTLALLLAEKARRRIQSASLSTTS